MEETKPSYSGSSQPEEIVKDIRQLMERSSRFISLSGLSGIAAGFCALAGSWIAIRLLARYKEVYSNSSSNANAGIWLYRNLIGLAVAVFLVAFLSSFLFTWNRTRKQGARLWTPAARNMAWSLSLPILTGAILILAMLQNGDWTYVGPACLLFYGLGLVNASRYTYSDIKWLGYLEIVLGLVNTQFIGYSLMFWAFGFGICHILYGIIMWWKHERKQESI